MKSLKWFQIFTLLIVVSLVLAACAPQVSQPIATPPAAEEAAPTEPPAAEEAAPTEAPAAVEAATEAPAAVEAAAPTQVVIGLDPDYSTFDPARTYEMNSPIVLNAVYDSLILFEGDITNPKPGAADSWEISPDGTQYTFKLHEGITFTSGNPLTSKDVKWSFERAKNLKGNPSFLLADIASIDTPDDYTVVVNLSKGDGAFLFKLTSQPFAILDSETVKMHGGVADETAATADTANTWLDYHSEGSGPFILESYTPDSEVVLVKNPNYWGKPAMVDKVILKDMPDSNTQMLTMAKGDIDMAASLNVDQIKQLESEPDVVISQFKTLSQMFLMVNQDPAIGGPLSNKDVQNAIRYALDYKGIHALIGEGTITTPAMIQVGFVGALPPLDENFTDLDKAKELLAAAGYADGFDTELQTITNSTEGIKWVSLAQKVQEDLKQVGINVEIKTTDSTVGYTAYRAGEWNFAINAWGPDYIDSNNQLAFLPGEYVGNRAKWTVEMNPTLAELGQKAIVEIDQAKRAELLEEIQVIMSTDSPFIPLAQFPRWIAAKTGLKGTEHTDAYRTDLRRIYWE